MNQQENSESELPAEEEEQKNDGQQRRRVILRIYDPLTPAGVMPNACVVMVVGDGGGTRRWVWENRTATTTNPRTRLSWIQIFRGIRI
ncbi:hypothetical protein Peur_012009 [Populus x canadensis]